MELNTLEDIQNYFPDEDSARKYLACLRWGKFAECPYCGNKKVYFIENGKRYKCASKLCHKKFSVTVRTLMEASNIDLNKWIMCIGLYAIKNSSIDIWDIEKKIQIAAKNAGHIKDKLDFCWKYVVKENNTSEKIHELIEGLFNLYDKKNELTPVYFLKDIDNISDIIQYRKVFNYTKSWLRRATWIITNQIQVEDILAETFIYMADNGIKEYNAESVSFYIRKICAKMWYEWMKAHPNTYRYYLDYHRQYQRNSRANISEDYVRSKLRKSYPEKAASEIYNDVDLIQKRKDKIKEFRKKFNLLEGFNSHFD